MNKLKQIIERIKEIFAKVKKLDITNSEIDRGIYLAEKFKQAVNNKALSVWVIITPNKIDDVLRTLLIKAANDILLGFAIFKECRTKENLEAQLQCVVLRLRDFPIFDRNAMYLKIASLLKKNLSALYPATINALVEERYTELKESGLLDLKG